MASASATVLFGLGRLDDGSVGPDRFSKDQGEREASPTEENSPVEQLNALPTLDPSSSTVLDHHLTKHAFKVPGQGRCGGRGRS
jgi:hypothetical protein